MEGRQQLKDLAVAGVITASESSWITPFTGLSPRQFGKLITALRREGADPVRKGRPWSLRWRTEHCKVRARVAIDEGRGPSERVE